MTRRCAIVAGSLVVLIVLSAFPAHACSCVQLDPRTALRSADAAFVGTLVSRKTGLLGLGSTTFTFRVEQVVKGELADRVDVESSSSGASCGLEVALGQRIGSLLYREANGWTSSLCSQVDPDALLRAAGPLPGPNGSGPLRFVVGGKFGGIRLLALDGSGRTLGYGVGEGSVLRLSVCPGSQRLAELVEGDGPEFPLRIAVRDLRTLEVLSETLLNGPALRVITRAPGIDVSAISCRDRFARQVVAMATDWPERSGRGHVLRIRGGAVDESARFRAQYGVFVGRRAYLFRGAPDWGMVALDVDTGAQATVANLPAETWQAVLSSNGTKVAGVIYSQDAPRPSEVFVMDLAARPPKVVTRPLHSANVIGSMVWLDDRTVGFFPGGGDEESITTFDTSLDALSSLEGWDDNRAVVVNGIAYGISGGAFTSARLPAGPITRLRTFDSPNTYSYVFVPGDVRVRASPPAIDPAMLPPKVHTDGDGSPDGAPAWPWVLVPLAGLAFVARLRHRRGRR
jgi:hypothetical protein